MAYKFSQQQITGINYYYMKIVESTFDEDDIRLLLIHLREFLRNKDNKNAQGRQNAMLLRELGDSVAHTIRDQSEIHRRIVELVKTMAASESVKWETIPFTLFDLDKLIEAFRNILTDTGVLYNADNVEAVFARESGDIKICLMSMLHGLLFKVKYSEIPNDFHFMGESDCICIRTELELEYVSSLRELRLKALIPQYGGGKWAQWLLCCKLQEPDKVSKAALRRTSSNEGHCEPVKALRCEGRLMISTIPTGVSPVEIYKVFRAASYDTHPLSKGVPLTKMK